MASPETTGTTADHFAQRHPAVIGAALHFGHVGADEAAATLVHLIGAGVITARPVTTTETNIFGRTVKRRTVELTLVSGKAVERHRPGHEAHLVREGHVEGLSRIDRCLLSIIFDHVAHDGRATMRDVRAFRDDHAASYGGAVREWRDLVRETAIEERLLGSDVRLEEVAQLRRLRSDVRRQLSAGNRVADPAGIHASNARLLETAVVYRLARSLSRALRLPAPPSSDLSPSAGIPNSMRWLHGGSGFGRLMGGGRP